MELAAIFTLGILIAVATAVPAILLKVILGRRIVDQKQEHASYLRQAEQESPDAMFRIDERGIVHSFNAAAERMFGYVADDVVGRHVGMLLPTAGSNGSSYGMNALHQGEETPNGIGLTVRGQRKNGTLVPLDLRLTEMEGSGPRLFLAVARDLTDRQLSEDTQRHLRFLESLLQSIGAPVAVLDRDGKVICHNRTFQEFTGYHEREPDNRHYWELLLEPADWSRARVSTAQVIAGQPEKAEVMWRRKSGELVPMVVAMSALRRADAPADSAVIVGFEAPEARLAESNTLEAVERLAGGIAQQFNELLTSINGYSELVLHTIEDRDPIRRDVERIKNAGERAAALTSQLLAFSRKQPMRSSVFSLNNLITEMRPMLEMLIGDRVQVSTVLDLNLGMLEADPGWMEQVILNLTVNARDAMPDGGKLIIETANEVLDAPAARKTGRLSEGEYVVLTVTDTGCGVDSETQSHAFEPFYKRGGKGLGLGLSTVYGVVRQCGGNVIMQSVPGSGTSVRIYLPAYLGSAEPGEKSAKGLFLVRGAGAR